MTYRLTARKLVRMGLSVEEPGNCGKEKLVGQQQLRDPDVGNFSVVFVWRKANNYGE